MSQNSVPYRGRDLIYRITETKALVESAEGQHSLNDPFLQKDKQLLMPL